MLKEVIERVREITDEYAQTLPADGDWLPTMFAIKDNVVKVSTFPMPPNGEIREFYFESVLPNQIRAQEPDAVVVLVSTWVSTVENEEELEKIETGDALMPSERPDRREAILIQGVSKDEEHYAMAEIIRSDGPPELEWEMFPGIDSMGGRMMASLRRGVWG